MPGWDPCSLGTHYLPNGAALDVNATQTVDGLLVVKCTRCGVDVHLRGCSRCGRWIRANAPHPLEACELPSPVTARGDDLAERRRAYMVVRRQLRAEAKVRRQNAQKATTSPLTADAAEKR